MKMVYTVKAFVRAFKSSLTVKMKLASILTLVAVCLYVSLFTMPLRNVLFKWYIRDAWRDVSTPDFVRMHFRDVYVLDGLYLNVSCSAMMTPTVQIGDINVSAIHDYYGLADGGKTSMMLYKGHGRFLPVLTVKQKAEFLYLFAIMEEAFKSREISFFLAAGSILGAVRHSGFIPWDDDLDVAVHVNNWQDVREALSCISGVHLEIFSETHWKFHFSNRKFPFIDIFFYKMDSHYLWALTHYTRITFIYRRENVFPLTTVDFEGAKMPLPRHAFKVIQRIYQYDVCSAYRGHITANRTGIDPHRLQESFVHTTLACKELAYVYPMSLLDT